MKDPRVNKIIGYIILAVGLYFVYKGSHYPTEEDPYNGKNYYLLALSAVFLISSLVWMIKKVRCPHCGCILNLKIANIDRCPQCHKKTYPD